MILELAAGLMEWQYRIGRLWNIVSGQPYFLRGVMLREDSEGQIDMIPLCCDLGVAKRLVDSVAGMQVEPVGGVSDEQK